MTHQPFARKYRPQTFDDLVGQPHITTTLTKALASQRLGQAYLFAGQRGVGKTSAARLLAKCLNCEQGPTATPCNRCPSCTQITAGSSLDVLEIDGASNRGIDEIRNLRESVPFAPTSGSFRVYIIDEVHMLTPEAFNALLKTLEEPPAHVKFIFATTAPNKVPATVLSRCQRFDFRRIESSLIVATLARVAKAEKVSVEERTLYAIARAADGSLRDAEVVLEQLASFSSGPITEADVTALLGVIETEALWTLTQAILDHDAPKALTTLFGQLEQGKEAPQLLAGLLRHLRHLLILAATSQAPSRDSLRRRLIDEPVEQIARLEEQARRSSEAELLMFLQIASGAYDVVRRSPMAQTILELVVIKLATRDQWQSLEQINRRLEQLSTAPQLPQRPVSLVSPSRSPTHEAAIPSSTPSTTLEPARPSASSQATVASFSVQWPVFLERLGAQKMSLAAYLAESQPLHLEGSTLTIGLPAFALHQEVLTVLEHRRLIERLLVELYHTPIEVQYATLPEPAESPLSTESAAAEPSDAPPIVQDIVKLFNATILDQPPRAA